MGDLATPLCLELAKALKRKPRELAEAMVDGLQLPMFVQSVSVEGAGYLNFRFDAAPLPRRTSRSVMAPGLNDPASASSSSNTNDHPTSRSSAIPQLSSSAIRSSAA